MEWWKSTMSPKPVHPALIEAIEKLRETVDHQALVLNSLVSSGAPKR